MDFYGEVLVEIMVALGAALFVANAFALLRRRADRRAAAKTAAGARPGSPVRGQVRRATTGNLDEAPIARTVTFMAVGLVVAIWGIASLTS